MVSLALLQNKSEHYMITFLENNTRPFRHWLTSHEGLLLGGSLGFFHSGPIGFVIGAWLGNYVSEKIQSTQQQVQRATQAVQPIVAPISFVNNKLQNLWQLTRSGYQAGKNWLNDKAQDIHPPTLKLPRDKTQAQDTHPSTTKPQDSQPNPQDSQPNPSILQTAGDLLDIMHGDADDSVYEQYGDSWLTRDISELPSAIFNQFRGLTQRFWSRPTVESTSPAIAQVDIQVNPRSTLH